MLNNFKLKNSQMGIVNIIYNLKILSMSVLKNLRTYLYIIIFPIVVTTFIIFYRVSATSTTINPTTVTAILLIQPFTVIFLVNITISEWKNSVFLKRIHSAGISKINFLSSIFIFNFILGYISFMLCSLYIFLITGSFFTTSNGGFWKILLDTMTTKEVFGILLSAAFLIMTSILLGTIISGVIKSVALSQTITAIYVIVAIAFSDIIMPPEIFAIQPILIKISYLFPYKHNVWAGLLLVADNSGKWIYNGASMGRLTTSFALKEWIPILTSIIWLILLSVSSIFVFKWDGK
ncbi:hypothetical protein [Mesoplasma coleopterae]|uniref:ABC transporter ATP-binding protein n=1 Tax=Mesoplasma coleopterae TaxID=324078 RepID=A0A2K8P190_9MOLU|nr:hypothetical protein [Mesoplasma coleopterae]ATZ20524.1 ABC transporter ATP-binding protein [Mesoplasma coleopterae]AVN62706.1 hypothetical protein CG000_00040 [Mesoplasma coleopterae]